MKNLKEMTRKELLDAIRHNAYRVMNRVFETHTTNGTEWLIISSGLEDFTGKPLSRVRLELESQRYMMETVFSGEDGVIF